MSSCAPNQKVLLTLAALTKSGGKEKVISTLVVEAHKSMKQVQLGSTAKSWMGFGFRLTGSGRSVFTLRGAEMSNDGFWRLSGL